MSNQVDINVCGCQGLIPCTYKTVVLKPNVIDGKNMLTQGMMDKPNTKYVIKHDYIIDDDIVNGSATVSTSNVSHCANPAYAEALAAYNIAHDAWIAADNAYSNNPNDTTLAAKNAAYEAYQHAEATLTGTPQYYYYASKAINVGKGRHVILADGAVLLDSTLSHIVDFEAAPVDTIVYVGALTAGSYTYSVQNTIVIPSGCLIEFEGGSISNGVLVGNNTDVEARLVKVFGNDIIFRGTWSIVEVYPEWFGAVGDGVTDDAACFIKASAFGRIGSGANKVYGVSGTLNLTCGLSGVKFKNLGLTKFVFDGDLHIEGCDFDANSQSVDKSLILFRSGNISISNSSIHDIHSHNENNAYGILVWVDTCRSTIENCTFKNISDYRRQGSSIGVPDGMCGAVFYSSETRRLTTLAYPQYLNGIYADNIYTANEDNSVNYTSYDADLVRIFFNDNNSTEEGLNSQNYRLNNIVGRNIQKRFLKISAGYNVIADNLVLEEQTFLGRPDTPGNMFAAIDCKNIIIRNVKNNTGHGDILFHLISAENVYMENLEYGGSLETTEENRKAIGCVIDDSKNVVIRNYKLTGSYQAVLRHSTSDNIDAELFFEGNIGMNNKFLCLNGNTASSSDNITLRGKIKTNKSLIEVDENHSINNLKILADIESTHIEGYTFNISDCKNFEYNGNFKGIFQGIYVDNQNLKNNNVESNVKIEGNFTFTQPIQLSVVVENTSFVDVKVDRLTVAPKSVLYSHASIFKIFGCDYVNIVSGNIEARNIDNTKKIHLWYVSCNTLNFISKTYVSENNNGYLLDVDATLGYINVMYANPLYKFINLKGSGTFYLTCPIETVRVDSSFTGRIVFNNFERYETLPTFDNNDKGTSVYDDTIKKPVWWNGTLWQEADGAVAGVKRSGEFANKPAATDIYVGFKYFCTDKQTTEGATNGIEIIHKGSNVWVDALGRVVS